MERVTLTIEGMSCGHCVRGVDQALRGVPGLQVDRVEVGSAVVSYDAAAVDPERIESAVAEEGYEVRGVRKTP